MDNTEALTLRQANGETIDRVIDLLKATALPYDDVRSKPDCFYLGYVGEATIATAGLEPYGQDGLLRSIAVEESQQGQGYGSALCGALEEQAREDGIRTLYLLTTTAASFFRTLDYRVIDREAVPATVRRSAEFTDLCPDSATCMRKHLGGDNRT